MIRHRRKRLIEPSSRAGIQLEVESIVSPHDIQDLRGERRGGWTPRENILAPVGQTLPTKPVAVEQQALIEALSQTDCREGFQVTQGPPKYVHLAGVGDFLVGFPAQQSTLPVACVAVNPGLNVFAQIHAHDTIVEEVGGPPQYVFIH